MYDQVDEIFSCHASCRAIMVTMDLMDSARRRGMTGDDTRASGPTGVSTAKGALAKPTETFTKGNFSLARLKARACSRLRRAMSTRVSGNRGESGERVCASGLTTANTRVTGREAKSTDRDA